MRTTLTTLLAPALVATVAVGLATGGAQAAVISVNFDDQSNTITGSTGAVNAGNWNHSTWGKLGDPVVTSNLINDSGVATTADLSLENTKTSGVTDGGGSVLSGATGEAAKLYTRRNKDGGSQFAVSEIAFSTYDVSSTSGIGMRH